MNTQSLKNFNELTEAELYACSGGKIRTGIEWNSKDTINTVVSLGCVALGACLTGPIGVGVTIFGVAYGIGSALA